jgi:hypothetical protein
MGIKASIEEWIKENGTNSLPNKLQYWIDRGIFNFELIRYFEQLFDEQEREQKDMEARKKVELHYAPASETQQHFCSYCGNSFRGRKKKYCSQACLLEVRRKQLEKRRKQPESKMYQREYYLLNSVRYKENVKEQRKRKNK